MLAEPWLPRFRVLLGANVPYPASFWNSPIRETLMAFQGALEASGVAAGMAGTDGTECGRCVPFVRYNYYCQHCQMV
jgi:hypothetical protein